MEIAIIVGLSGLCLWFAWRLYSLRRGIEELTGALTQDPPPPLRDVADVATQQRLLTLSTAALDTVTEATLLRDSERNRRDFLEALLNEIKDAIFCASQVGFCITMRAKRCSHVRRFLVDTDDVSLFLI